jgi:hypothetical protein
MYERPGADASFWSESRVGTDILCTRDLVPNPRCRERTVSSDFEWMQRTSSAEDQRGGACMRTRELSPVP